MICGTPILGNLHMFTMFTSIQEEIIEDLRKVKLPALLVFQRSGMSFSEADICGHLRTCSKCNGMSWILFYHVLSHGHSRWSWHWIPLRVWSFCRSRLARSRAVSSKQCPQLLPTWVLPTLLHQHAESLFPAYKFEILYKLIKLGFFEPKLLLHVKNQIRSSSHFFILSTLTPWKFHVPKNRPTCCRLFGEPIELQDDPGLDPVCWKALGSLLGQLEILTLSLHHIRIY